MKSFKERLKFEFESRMFTEEVIKRNFESLEKFERQKTFSEPQKCYKILRSLS